DQNRDGVQILGAAHGVDASLARGGDGRHPILNDQPFGLRRDIAGNGSTVLNSCGNGICDSVLVHNSPSGTATTPAAVHDFSAHLLTQPDCSSEFFRALFSRAKAMAAQTNPLRSVQAIVPY